MKITVIGTGYVGLVTGTCFAEMGNTVICVDVDPSKVSALLQGEIPIYEPGLEPMVKSNLNAGRLHFTTHLPEALAQCDVLFIAVGTPQGEDGSADLSHVMQAACDIGANMQAPLVVVTKSTVPVGTADKVRNSIAAELALRGTQISFDVASNPEFLKEGTAVKDFMSPDRVIVGTDNVATRELMRELYSSFMRTHDRLMFMGTRDAELTKYASNAMLATKISFINEIANIASLVGADIEQVRLGLGADERIGHHFIYPGCGYGGSCFPKDVTALRYIARQAGFEPLMLDAVAERNIRQKKWLFTALQQHYGNQLSGRKIAIWGLSFKPGTDDIREASSLELIRALLDAGAAVHAHDPVAMPHMRALFSPTELQLHEDPYSAIDGAEALVLVTEWKLYRQPDFARIKELMKHPLILDGRNQYNPAKLTNIGFAYRGIGR
jgi:UDPglucose 6-dehydrogenase